MSWAKLCKGKSGNAVNKQGLYSLPSLIQKLTKSCETTRGKDCRQWPDLCVLLK